MIDRRSLPRGKACGGALTPRATHQLIDMGLGPSLDTWHRHVGITVAANERPVQLNWPTHPVFPPHGHVVRRRQFDQMVANHAVAAGAQLLEQHEAKEPIAERGFVRGAMVQSPGGRFAIRARYVLVADGGNSRFGRMLGTIRRADWPYALGARSYWETPRDCDDHLELGLDLHDRNGNVVPGYGWLFPLGDGTANVGVGVLSTAREFKSINPTHVLDNFARRVAERWDLDPSHPVGSIATGRIPLGGSVAPCAGPTFLVIGDAAAAASPFSGDGIGAAFETARIAADVLHEALTSDDATVLQRYPKLIDEQYGDQQAAGRLFARVVGRPALARELTRIVVHSRSLMEWSLRITTGMLRPDELGPAEAAYRAISLIARVAPGV